MRKALGVLTAALVIGFAGNAAPARAQDGKLRIIAFGAHPDDAELTVGGNGGEVGGARASRQVRLRHQRRYRALEGGRRSARAPPHGGSAGDGEAARHHHPGARHSRRRGGAHAGEPAHDHAAHSGLEGGHRDGPPPERLSSRPPGRRSARAGRLLHGDGARSSARTPLTWSATRSSCPSRIASRGPIPSRRTSSWRSTT